MLGSARHRPHQGKEGSPMEQEKKTPSRRKCPACGKITRTQGKHCPNPDCDKPMDPNDPYYTDNKEENPMARTAYKVCAKCNLKVAMTDSFCRECGSQKFNVMDKPEKDPLPPTPPTPPTPNPNPIPIWKEEETMENKKTGFRWWWIIVLFIVAIAGAIYLTQMVTGYRNEISRLQSTNSQAANIQANNYVPVYVTPAPEAAPAPAYVPQANNNSIPVYNGNETITVFRGDTDQETILFNDSWPGYYANQNFNWFGENGLSNIHMLGGTYTVPSDGIISGDVEVDGTVIYDNNEKTFLVIHVREGQRVTVNPDWKAWYTTQYSENLIVKSVQTQFPTWSRQYSKLN